MTAPLTPTPLSEAVARVVATEVCLVYRAGGRRYLTKRSAFRAVARTMIRARCYCDLASDLTPSEVCHYHEPQHYPALLKRLTRRLARLDRKSRRSAE